MTRFSSIFLIISFIFATNASHICLETACSSFNVEADIVIAVDTSNAFDQTTFETIRQFLYNFVNTLTISNIDSQVAIYGYGTSTQSVINLSDGAKIDKLKNAINNTLKYQGSSERNLFQAFSKIQVEIIESSGLRSSDYKKVLVVVAGDSWTGNSVIGSSLLLQIQQKFDVILSIGIGGNAIANLNSQLPQLSVAKTNTFYAASLDQLSYASAWISAFSCPGVQVSTPIPQTTQLPTQSPSVPCSLSSLNYDVYLIVDVSNSMTSSEFATMKSTIRSFVDPFPIGDGATQFALVTTGLDSELYYTAFHNGQSRNDVLTSINGLIQDDTSGQSLNLALNALQSYLSQQFSVSNKIIVYFTSTTKWDVSPYSTINSFKSNYSVFPLAVQWTKGASLDNLTTFVGGSSCVNSVENVGNAATWLQSKMCSKSFC